MADKTFFKKLTNINFTVKNLDRRRIKVFNYPISPGQTRDLLAIPEISESDIRHSLIKGELANFIRLGVVTVISSSIDLTQYDSSQQKFLSSAGAADRSTIIGSIIFGGGHDGPIKFDGTTSYTDFTLANGVYTQLRDSFLSDGAEVESGIAVYTAGFRLFCNGTLTNNGVIHNDGKNASGATAGGSSSLGSLGIGVAGGNGRTNNTGLNGSSQSNGLFGINARGGAGGAGGANAGGTGGNYTSVSAGNGGSHWLFPMHSGFLLGQTSGGNQAQLQIIGGGSGGGGGGSDSASATGGGGGGAGGVLILNVFNFINNGIVRANGGNGANAIGASGNAGGGGGGGGGVVNNLCRFIDGSGIMLANGGLGGTGVGTGVNGLAGEEGEVHQHTV